ncbi:hypothetical protein [Robertkochia solimangrovi]|uniref:hypothetical protein n=1 Tax=Robertkochia solimangrovi TaxID=2213046 RepID=UPI00117FCEDB|nr:hypothetical protein [Robertkochia solimangrovi]TRZ41617.1 hypothetical protein DMZ48_16545 [Robertkochia solimangrovi]
MEFKKHILKVLIWLPSLVISVFYFKNAGEKILNAGVQDKVVSNELLIIITGVILMVATLLFLINRTLLWGTVILSLYMTLIVIIHIYKGKPFEVTILIVMATIFAAWLRKPKLFIP